MEIQSYPRGEKDGIQETSANDYFQFMLDHYGLNEKGEDPEALILQSLNDNGTTYTAYQLLQARIADLESVATRNEHEEGDYQEALTYFIPLHTVPKIQPSLLTNLFNIPASLIQGVVDILSPIVVPTMSNEEARAKADQVAKVLFDDIVSTLHLTPAQIIYAVSRPNGNILRKLQDLINFMNVWLMFSPGILPVEAQYVMKQHFPAALRKVPAGLRKKIVHWVETNGITHPSFRENYGQWRDDNEKTLGQKHHWHMALLLNKEDLKDYVQDFDKTGFLGYVTKEEMKELKRLYQLIPPNDPPDIIHFMAVGYNTGDGPDPKILKPPTSNLTTSLAKKTPIVPTHKPVNNMSKTGKNNPFQRPNIKLLPGDLIIPDFKGGNKRKGVKGGVLTGKGAGSAEAKKSKLTGRGGVNVPNITSALLEPEMDIGTPFYPAGTGAFEGVIAPPPPTSNSNRYEFGSAAYRQLYPNVRLKWGDRFRKLKGASRFFHSTGRRPNPRWHVASTAKSLLRTNALMRRYWPFFLQVVPPGADSITENDAAKVLMLSQADKSRNMSARVSAMRNIIGRRKEGFNSKGRSSVMSKMKFTDKAMKHIKREAKGRAAGREKYGSAY